MSSGRLLEQKTEYSGDGEENGRRENTDIQQCSRNKAVKMDTRALRNPYPDYDGSPASTQALFDSQGKLTPEFAQRLSSKVSELLAVMENGLKSADPRDCTGYTGWAGIALLYLHLHNVFREEYFLQRALEYVSRSLRCLTRRHDVTFLCGDAGPLAVAAVVYHRLQRGQETDECINRLLQYHQTVVKGSGGLPDELLYGRVGYLYSLVFINQQLGQDRIPLQYIQQISEAVLASGEHLSRKYRVQNQSPLMYEWYQEHYVGAAHGLAGIYYFLMQPGFVSVEEYVHRLVKPSVDHVCRLKTPSGNYPPCIGDDRDLLVHWCHGSPGVVYMLLQAYRVKTELILGRCESASKRAERGGNSRSLDALQVARVPRFADWCMNYGKHGCRTPDTPFSLFEGMAGTIYFLADLLQPMKARFPAFEV
ncbi:glutathione S-transferase LANCL1 [Xiphias gladius]|uniref:glutathione S-transferase LANCL1 n=1 Tax=Xiphias gladius TaxID=8245 RepID=UPI001A982480|nr:glutathione S-transferase LANCL1 [Xiphias gladius]